MVRTSNGHGPHGRSLDAVVFDWGGTLTTYVPVDPVLVWTDAARCLAPNDMDRVRDALSRVEAAFWLGVHDEAWSGSLVPLMEVAVAKCGLAVTASLLEQAQHRHLERWTVHVEHRADASDTLAAIRERGLKVGLLSNTVWPASYHDALLARDGLMDLIDVRHYTCEHERMKPHPDAFAAVLRELDVAEPRSAVFVGDRPFDDVYGARRAGMRTVLIPNELVPAYDVEADARISSLAELLDVLDRWMT